MITAGMKLLRTSFCNPVHQFANLGFTVIFFHFDYKDISESFLLDFFMVSIVFTKASSLIVFFIFNDGKDVSHVTRLFLRRLREMPFHQKGQKVQTAQRQDPIKGQLDEPKSLLGLFMGAWETHRQLHHWKTPSTVLLTHRQL